MKQNMGPQVKKEISIMKQLKHPNVVQVKEVLASSTKIFIIMQYLSHGALRSEIVSRGLFALPLSKMHLVICLYPCVLLGGTLSEDEARRFFRQMVKGLQYVHSQGVCHRDLKVDLVNRFVMLIFFLCLFWCALSCVRLCCALSVKQCPKNFLFSSTKY